MTWTGTLIAKNIWVGPVPKHQMHEFVAVVFCAQELQPNERAARYFTREAVLCPLDDALRPFTIEETLLVMSTASKIASLSRRGPVAVTCAMGINRSALVAATALHLRIGIDGSEARRLVQHRRHGTLINPSFVNFVDNLKHQVPLSGQVRRAPR